MGNARRDLFMVKAGTSAKTAESIHIYKILFVLNVHVHVVVLFHGSAHKFFG